MEKQMCSCIPNWMSDITDCAMKDVCADCKQPMRSEVGFYFSLFIPCRIALGKVHVCATQLHEHCTRTWTYEFEASGHDKLCDRHPFATILPDHITRQLHMQCLVNHLTEKEMGTLVADIEKSLAVAERALEMLATGKFKMEVDQQLAVHEEAEKVITGYRKQLEWLKKKKNE